MSASLAGRALVVSALAACGLETRGELGGGSTSDGDARAATFDAAAPGDSGGVARPDAATSDADASAASLCDPTDPTLRLCLRFEGAVVDESASKLAPSLTNNLTFVAGKHGSAVSLSPSPATDLRFANTPTLRPAQISFELWFFPRSLPAAGRMMLLDLHNEAGVMLDPGGDVRCRAPDVYAVTKVQANAWSHVACTFDGATLRVYLNGVLEGQGAAAYGANTTDFSGVGQESPSGLDRFDGLVDSVRVWSVARTPAQIAASAAL